MKPLHSKQLKFVDAIVAGATILEASRGAGVSEQSGHSWKKLPEVHAAIDRGRAAAEEARLQTIRTTRSLSVEKITISIDNVSQRLRYGAERAVDYFIEVLENPDVRTKDRLDAGTSLIRLCGVEKLTVQQSEQVESRPKGLSNEAIAEIKRKVLGIEP